MARPKLPPTPWNVGFYRDADLNVEMAVITATPDNKKKPLCVEVCRMKKHGSKAVLPLLAAAPDLLKVLEEFVEDVRAAYIGQQKPEMVNLSALYLEWPDLVQTFHNARAAIARAKGGQ